MKCKHGKDYLNCCECRYGSKFNKNGDFVSDTPDTRDLVDLMQKGERSEKPFKIYRRNDNG